jgi:hypothetical protein
LNRKKTLIIGTMLRYLTHMDKKGLVSAYFLMKELFMDTSGPITVMI